MPEKCILEFSRYDLDGFCHFRITCEALELLKEIFCRADCELELHEVNNPRETDYHMRTREVLDSLFLVQGKKRVKGESVIPAIESLILKYCEARDGTRPNGAAQ